MLIELTKDVSVRVPDDRVPLNSKNSLFHTFKAKSKVNYSSEPRGPGQMLHKFSASAGRYGVITHMCVTDRYAKPEWL